jgi:hypothetical protein
MLILLSQNEQGISALDLQKHIFPSGSSHMKNTFPWIQRSKESSFIRNLLELVTGNLQYICHETFLNRPIWDHALCSYAGVLRLFQVGLFHAIYNHCEIFIFIFFNNNLFLFKMFVTFLLQRPKLLMKYFILIFAYIIKILSNNII